MEDQPSRLGDHGRYVPSMNNLICLVTFASTMLLAQSGLGQPVIKFVATSGNDAAHVIGSENDRHSVYKYNLATNTLEKSAELMDFNGCVVFVDNDSRTIVIDARTDPFGGGEIIGRTFDGKKIWSRDVGSCTDSFNIDPANKTAYFSGSNREIISLTTGENVGRFAGVGTDFFVSPDGKLFVYEWFGRICFATSPDLKADSIVEDSGQIADVVFSKTGIYVSDYLGRLTFFDRTDFRKKWQTKSTFIHENLHITKAGSIVAIRYPMDFDRLENISLVSINAKNGAINETIREFSPTRYSGFRYLNDELMITNHREIRRIKTNALVAEIE